MADGKVHSKLGASSYYRWGNCPGSVRLSEGIESSESIYAEEGTRAHEIAAQILETGTYSGQADDETLEAVKVYVDFVESLAPRKHDSRLVWRKIEQSLNLSKYHSALFGTADAVIYFYATKRLVVIDYKHGQGIPVDVIENKQLMYYGLGAIQALGHPVQELELVIVQPRCYHPDGPVRTWKTDPIRVMSFLADLIDDAYATESPQAPLKAGEWCRFCPAKAQCPELKQTALELARQEFSPSLSYDPAKLSDTLHALPQLEAFIKGVREFAYREAQHGRVPPGWKLVAKRATRKWKDGLDEATIAKEFGLKPPDVYEVKIKSPAQVEKVVPKDLRGRMAALVVQESSGLTLAPDSDNRPPAAIGAGKVFGDADFEGLD